jgi:hypothetical protein
LFQLPGSCETPGVNQPQRGKKVAALLPAGDVSYFKADISGIGGQRHGGMGQMWCAASLADRRRTERTSEGARRSAVPQMGHSEQAVVLPKEEVQKRYLDR